MLVEDTDVGSPPQSNPSKPAGLAPMVAIRASLVCGRSIPGGFRKIRALREATYFVGMRKAGMLEE